MAVLACFSYLSASAYDFEADGLYFTITSLKDLTVSVDGAVNKGTDKIVIPQTIVYKGRTLTVTSVGDNAFSGSAFSDLQSVTLPNTILSIGKDAFSWTSIKDIRFPSSLTSIGESAFSYTKLCSIALPDNIEDIPSFCFFCCDSLKSIQWPKRLRSIGGDAFYGCEALTNFTIPPSVVEISPSIIENCKSLNLIYVYAKKVPSTGLNSPYRIASFGGCDSKNSFVYVPKGTYDAYKRSEFGYFEHIIEFDANSMHKTIATAEVKDTSSCVMKK